MGINLNDWLGDHVWAWWLALALVCLGTELVAHPQHGGARQGRIFAGGAVAATVTAVVLPRGWAIQVVVGLLVAASLWFGRGRLARIRTGAVRR